MNQVALLKESRDALLRLHKSLLDHERRIYEEINGAKTPTEFLTLLLEDPSFAWLRKFSTLIVEIDEMFAQKDGYTQEAVTAHITAVRALVAMEDGGEDFKEKYRTGLQQADKAAEHHARLQSLLFNE